MVMKNIIYIWVDDVRPMPTNYDFHYKSVWEFIRNFGEGDIGYECDYIIDLDHDAGDYGDDYIKILEWLEELKYVEGKEPCKLFYLHTGNPVGRERMRQIIKRCGWEEKEVEWELI